MIDHPPLAFSDRQMAMLRRAAQSLPPDRRNDFLARVAKRLAPEPSDAAVSWAINKLTASYLGDQTEGGHDNGPNISTQR